MMKREFKEEESIEILKILGILNLYNYFKNMSHEFRLKNIDEIRKYFVEEIKQNELMSRKHKKAYKTINYIKHFPIVASAITACISISDFAS